MDDEKRRLIPLLITLIAAAICVVINLIARVEFGVFVLRLFFTVLVFYVIGYIVYVVFCLALKNEKDTEEENENEGEGSIDENASEPPDDDEDEDE